MAGRPTPGARRKRLPDLLTFRKICAWIKIDPAEILGIPTQQTSENPVADAVPPEAAVHLRAEQALPQAAAADLAFRA